MPKPKPVDVAEALAALEARVRALECHNGWAPSDDEPEPQPPSETPEDDKQ